MSYALSPKVTRFRGKILIVDDEPRFRALLHHILQKSGYEVLEAGSGKEALHVLQTGENQLIVDLIVCDIRMPEMQGTQAIPAFRERYPSIPVVVLTGFPDPEMAARFLKQGVSDYTLKPIEQDKLLAVIEKAMEQRIALITSALKV